MSYSAPVSDIRFILNHVVDFGRVAATERFSDATPDMTDAILTEAGKLCDDVLAPLRRNGDLHPARLENGIVITSPGFAEGYRAIADGGWIGINAASENGGMGLPVTMNVALNDMMSGACLALQLCPLLSQGQIEALEHHASDEIKALYLPKLISGEWSGTMNLTEAGAGSDVGALQSKAEDNGDGTYAVSGQKIFISWGDQDITANICHLVLARLPGGPKGTKGISLFMVPKYIPDANGDPGAPNNVKTVSLEHKLGLHGSPTAVMQYEKATGWMIGRPHDGMAAMFTMMNNARLGVAIEGVGVAEGAYQHALAYAQERRQGHTANGESGISGHPDVRRMLASMKADIFAARSVALSCAVAIDMAKATDDADWRARAALLTPIAKAFCTDTGVSVSSAGVQVHGGMGVIEETGAAQFSRDVRVTAIYEGTNGIQAMDLVGRKMMDNGDGAKQLLDEVQALAESARTARPDLADAVWEAAESLRETTEWLVSQPDMNERFAGAVAYLQAFARVLGAFFHLKASLAEPVEGRRTALARVYVDRLLPDYLGLLVQARAGATSLYALSLDDLVA